MRAWLCVALLLGLVGCPSATIDDDDDSGDDDDDSAPTGVTSPADIAGLYDVVQMVQNTADGPLDLEPLEATVEITAEGVFTENTGSLRAVSDSAVDVFCSRQGVGSISFPLENQFVLEVEYFLADETLSGFPDSCIIGNEGADEGFDVRITGRISQLFDDGAELSIESIELDGAPQEPPTVALPLVQQIRLR